MDTLPTTHPQLSDENAWQLVALSEIALSAGNLEIFVTNALPAITVLSQATCAFLYLGEAGLGAPGFFQHGLPPSSIPALTERCAAALGQFTGQPGEQTQLAAPSPEGGETRYGLYATSSEGKCTGLLGLPQPEGAESPAPALMERVLRLLSEAIHTFIMRAKSERQLAHLNAYLTISSVLAQSLGLHEQLEVALYSCMDLVAAETASVLLLDDEKRHFNFYHVEGPSKPVLEKATFPAEAGLAGSVLQARQPEVINNVHDDPRFYGQIDAESGFQTQNILVIPLVAGEEPVGVLEVLNKTEGGIFSTEDLLLLASIAEEIAFAIRNAKIFEYVVNSYCKQRQGEMSCRGCKRPLGSWTPCVRYREAAL